MTAKHQPVLLAEALELLKVTRGETYIDATFGRGGHTQALLAQGARVFAFDVDQAAIDYGTTHFAQALAAGDLTLIRSNFDEMDWELKERQVGPVAGVLFDFGTSTDQLTDAERGFSFESTAELDMRMDQRLAVKASDLLKAISEKELALLFHNLGGEELAKPIAKRIMTERKAGQLQYSGIYLANLIAKIKHRQGKLHPATKVFQALRIAVNTEGESIAKALPLAFAQLQTKGRLVTIAFHEGEDRPVKQYFKKLAATEKASILTKKPIQASVAEIQQNPNARSAKLRAIEKQA